MRKLNIVLLTSGQPSVNPRLVKEADALFAKGHNVTVIYQYWDIWAQKADTILLKNKKWTAICVAGTPETSKIVYFLSKLSHKISRLLLPKFGLKYTLPEQAISRSCYLLYIEALKHKADIYIGHNPGALAPTVWAAKKKKVKCGFDAEDFHRNERSNDPNNSDVKLKTYLENKYFPQLNYLITASPQITDEYKKFFPDLKPTTILNVFPKYKGSKSMPYTTDNPLKLFWFSQKIGPDRGLQDVFKALKILEKETLEFHILGKPRPTIKAQFDELIESLKFNNKPSILYYEPMDGETLMHFTAQFDIGLALEPGFSRNNEIALSNKLFTYINVGLATIVSNTIGQKAFIDTNPEIGKSYPAGNPEALANQIKHYLDHPIELNTAKLKAYQAAQTLYNWEVESEKIVALVEGQFS